MSGYLSHHAFVTSLAEVWSEICRILHLYTAGASLPLRKCGLKSSPPTDLAIEINVTSLAEVWIEIAQEAKDSIKELGHFPCGSVD